MRLFICGAGTTIGTLGLPGVAGFGQRLAEEVPDWRAKLPTLAVVVDALDPVHRRTKNDWDLDAAWTHLDYLAKLHKALETMHFPSSASHELHAALVAVYGNLNLGWVRSAYDAGQSFTLSEELRRVTSGDVVVSFNWDVLVEALLLYRLRDTPSVRVVQAPHKRLERCVEFAKPHGSLAWNRYDLGAIGHDTGPTLGPIPTAAEVLWTEHEPDLKNKKEPLLLGAVPIKSELIAEVDRPQHAIVMAQWATFLRGLTEASEVCVLGYSFPKEDAYGRFLMREAIRRRTRPITRVDLYEVPTKFPGVRDAIVEVLGVSPEDVVDRGKMTECPVRA